MRKELYCHSRFPFGSVNNTTVKEKMDSWITKALLSSKILQSTKMKLLRHFRSAISQKKQKNNSVTPNQKRWHHTASSVRAHPPSSCSSYVLSRVIVRIVRLVSFCPPEAELCSCDPPVHLFNVLTLGLKVVCGVIRAGHKYLEEIREADTDYTTEPDYFFFSSENTITWLFFPSSLGTNRCRTETNLDLRRNNVHGILFKTLKCSFHLKRYQLLHDGLKKLQRWLDFSLRIAGFCCRAHRGDVNPVCRHIVSARHHRYVDVCMNEWL